MTNSQSTLTHPDPKRIGQRAKVITDHNGHRLNIGTIVICTNIYNVFYVCETEDGSMNQFLDECDLEWIEN